MNIATLQSNLDFIKSLYFHEEWKDEKCRDRILEAIEEANEKIEQAFGESMHYLDEHKPSVEAVEKVAQKFPSTLSYTDGEDGRIPIQTAVTGGDGFKYVTILAKEGSEIKVGGEDARGGLLMIDPTDGDRWNTLQMFSNISGDNDEDDEDAVHVLKELQKSGLLLKTDIREQQLLFTSFFKQSKKRFEYLVSWDPDALIDIRYDRKPFAHAIKTSEKLAIFLESSFKYYPNMGGLLFLKDDEGDIAFDTMCNKIGTKDTMTVLYDLLTPKSNYPILHHIFTKAPQHKDLFMEYFPWAYHLKDQNNRTLHQAVLAAGPDMMSLNKHLFASLSDNQIRKKDPLTTLYPFAAMAVGEHADLEKTFYLLRRQPSVLDRRSRSGNIRRGKKRRIKK